MVLKVMKSDLHIHNVGVQKKKHHASLDQSDEQCSKGMIIESS